MYADFGDQIGGRHRVDTGVISQAGRLRRESGDHRTDAAWRSAIWALMRSRLSSMTARIIA